jgi:hypothetical protein
MRDGYASHTPPWDGFGWHQRAGVLAARRDSVTVTGIPLYVGRTPEFSAVPSEWHVRGPVQPPQNASGAASLVRCVQATPMLVAKGQNLAGSQAALFPHHAATPSGWADTR